MSVDLRSAFLEFLKGVEGANEESLTKSLELLSQRSEIGEEFARVSPKFVEIFSRLKAGEFKGKVVSSLFYSIISVLFDVLAKKPETFHANLHYLADTIIKRHLTNLYVLMSRKKGDLAIRLLVQAASVDGNHCRDLFYSLRFGKEDPNSRFFKNQVNGEGRNEFLKLATLFLRNPETSFHCLGTKHYISSIWENLAKADHFVSRQFVEAMISALKEANLMYKKWVFVDKTWDKLAQYPFDSRDVDTTEHAVYRMIESVLTGPDSILVEDPKRVYCKVVQDLEDAPKNMDLLGFLRKLDPWKDPSHRDMAILIFKRSPDLIARYLTTVNRPFQASVTLPNASAVVFLSYIIELDWPEFLHGDTGFFEEGRSLDLLFESILPSVLKNSDINLLIKSPHVLLKKEIIVLLSKAVIKFSKLPEFLKQSSCYTVMRGRLEAIKWGLLGECVKSPTLLPFALKLFILMDSVFPFFLSDIAGKEPQFLKEITSNTPIVQLLTLKMIPLLPQSMALSKIPLLCSMVVNNDLKVQIRHAALSYLHKIVLDTGLFTGHEEEVPIWIGEAIGSDSGNKLYGAITNVQSQIYYYAGNEANFSPLWNNRWKDDNPLIRAKQIIQIMKDPSSCVDIDLSPTPVLGQLKWFALEAVVVLLCASLANGVTDVDFTLKCIFAVVTMDIKRTLPYVLNNSYVRGCAFRGSSSLDDFVVSLVEMNGGCDEELYRSFLKGNVSEDLVMRMAPFVHAKSTRSLIRRMMSMNLPIIDVIKSPQEPDLSHLSPIWKWVFEGYQPIDLTKLGEKILKRITDEDLILDIMRTMWLTSNRELANSLQIPVTSNPRLLLLIDQLCPEFMLFQELKETCLPLCILKNWTFPESLAKFERTNKTWCYDYLLQQIRVSPFQYEVSALSESKVHAVTAFFLAHPGDTLIQTFGKIIVPYLVSHPEVAEEPVRFKSVIFDDIAKQMLEPGRLVRYGPQQFEGVVNVMLGAPNIFVPLRMILFLAVHLGTYPPFYRLLEAHRISPSTFLFLTGEVAKIAIDTLDAGQKIITTGLWRNSAYLLPFRMASKVEMDTPMFRFLLHFSSSLLTTFEVPIDTFMESGALVIIMRALSSTNDHTRDVAYAALSNLYDLNLKHKDWASYLQLSILLESLLNAVDVPSKRFTSLITYFLARAALIIMSPSRDVYVPTIKFLASAPALRTNSVPLFSALFGSDEHEWSRQERNYILKMMKDGIREAADVELLNTGRVIERLEGFFASPLSDSKSRDLVLDVLRAASKYSKLKNVVMWIYSVLTETFSVFHVDKLINLALSMKHLTDPEKDCCVLIAKEAVLSFKDKLSPDTRDKAETVLCQPHQILQMQ